MKKVTRRANDLGPEASFAAEYWISSKKIKGLAGTTKLLDLVQLTGRGSTGKEVSPLFLDTSAANHGLLDVSKIVNGRMGERISHKKVATGGSVIMSRLRPYLRQVAYVPQDIFEIMECSDVLCSTEFYILEPVEKEQSIAFLTPWLLSDEIQDIFQQATTGGHHPRFEKELLANLSVPDEVIRDRKNLSKQVADTSVTYVKTQLQMTKLIKRYS